MTRKKAELTGLEEQMSDPNFWSDRKNAEKVASQIVGELLITHANPFNHSCWYFI